MEKLIVWLVERWKDWKVEILFRNLNIERIPCMFECQLNIDKLYIEIIPCMLECQLNIDKLNIERIPCMLECQFEH